MEPFRERIPKGLPVFLRWEAHGENAFFRGDSFQGKRGAPPRVVLSSSPATFLETFFFFRLDSTLRLCYSSIK